MTATLPEHAVERLTDQEEAILRSWHAGNDTRDIARAHKLDFGKISAIIGRLCNYDRAIAALALEKGVRPQLPTPPPPAARPHVVTRPIRPDAAAPAPKPESEPVPPVAEPEPVPEPPAPAAPVAPTPEAIEALLIEAEQLGGRLRNAAKQIRASVDELRLMVHRREAEEAARILVAQKRRELEDAENALRELLTGKPAVSAATIRAWARNQGIDCPGTGWPPRAVIDRYYEAHPEVGQ